MPALIPWRTNMGGWTIGSTNMCGPAWQPMDLEQLWAPAPTRGKDRMIPGASGTVAKPRRIDSRTVAMKFWLTGAVDQAGSAHSDPVEGFVDNVDAISALVTPPTLPTVTRTSTLTMPDASTRTAQILVESFEYERESGTLARAVLTITIPAGAHT